MACQLAYDARDQWKKAPEVQLRPCYTEIFDMFLSQ